MTLPTTYWGPKAWFERFYNAQKHDVTQIEVCDSFPKQTLRNRCFILSPTGEKIMLTVPLKKVETKQLTRDIRISYQQHWQHQHWTAILSAYKKSPYFDYYADFIRPLYEHEYDFLLDLNEATFEIAGALLNNVMPSPGMKPLTRTTEWQNADLDAFWGDEISILNDLFLRGPLALAAD